MLYRICILVFLCLIYADNVIAASLSDRLERFPQWHDKPSLEPAKGDLNYPDWMVGTWEATSTSIEQIAPLAPNIVTPGFEDNRRYLNKPIQFQVKFIRQPLIPTKSWFKNRATGDRTSIVADLAFNGRNIAEAYLGRNSVIGIKVDPDNPNKQITLLEGERSLISTVTGRVTEKPQVDRFIATEISQQLFRSPARIYLNEVETTSDYYLQKSGDINGEQMTAIYLSPQDPDYFRAGDRPVAIYRYRLHLHDIKQKLN